MLFVLILISILKINAQLLPQFWEYPINSPPDGSFSVVVDTSKNIFYCFRRDSPIVHIYSPAQNQWKQLLTPTGLIPDQLPDEGLITSDQQIYFFGGNSYPSNLLVSFNLGNSVWNRIFGTGATPPRTQGSLFLLVINNNFQSLFYSIPEFYFFNQNTQIWTTSPLANYWNESFVPLFATFRSFNSNIYVLSAADDTLNFQKFNIDFENATTLSTPPTENGFMFSILLEDDRISQYINMFVQTDGYCSVLQFDTTSETWIDLNVTVPVNVCEDGWYQANGLVGDSGNFYIIASSGYANSDFRLDMFVITNSTNRTLQVIPDPLVPPPKAGAATWNYNGYLYIGGGLANETKTEIFSMDFLLYDFETQSWKNLTNLQTGAIPGPRYQAASALYQNTGYLYGGVNGSSFSYTCLYDFYQIDFLTLNWTQIPVNISDICIGVLVNLNQYLYLVGGDYTSQVVKGMSSYQYDILQNKWTNVTQPGGPPSGLDGYASAYSGVFIYIFGGYAADTPMNVLYEFDVQNLVWDVIQTSDKSVVTPPSGYGGVLIPWGIKFQFIYMFSRSYWADSDAQTSLFLFDYESLTWEYLSIDQNPITATFSIVVSRDIFEIFTYGGQSYFGNVFNSIQTLTVCPGGTNFIQDAMSCGACPPGTSSSIAQLDCINCLPGTYNGLYGQDNCDGVCPTGTFGPIGGQTDVSGCIGCPAGTYLSNIIAADSIKFCHLCPVGTFGNITGNALGCIPCDDEEIDQNMCGLGTVFPSPNFLPQITALPVIENPPDEPWWQILALFGSVAAFFILLVIAVYAPLTCRKIVHEKLIKIDLFPRIPKVIDRSDHRVKFYSPFGGVVVITLIMFLVGWAALNITNYKMFNTQITTSLDPDDYLEKQVTLNIYSVGYSGNCVGFNSSCSDELEILIDGYQVTDLITCTSFGQTCLITINITVEELANSIVSVEHVLSDHYNQGWTWEMSTFQNISTSEFVGQSIGRQIFPENSTLVFNGALPTSDVVFMTPYRFYSELSTNHYKAISLNNTGVPRLGSMTGPYNSLGTGVGLSFNLKTVLNPYTKVTTESQKHGFIELLVAMFSVLGSVSLADKLKSVVEVTHTEIKTRKRNRKLRKLTSTQSSTSSMDSVSSDTAPLLSNEN